MIVSSLSFINIQGNYKFIFQLYRAIKSKEKNYILFLKLSMVFKRISGINYFKFRLLYGMRFDYRILIHSPLELCEDFNISF